jgi:hypothetical protein
LGITLERLLTFNEHLSTLSKKIRSRYNLGQMLARTGWGADAKTLRITALSLVYSTAEYGFQVWCNNTHVSKIDTQLNSVMRVISRVVKSTLLQWLPTLTNIKPPHICRKDTLVKTIKKSVDYKHSLLYQMMLQTPNQRLKFRSPSVEYARTLISLGFDSAEEWRKEWSSFIAPNRKLICDPNDRILRMNFSRCTWSTLNRLRTSHGRCGYLLYKTGFQDKPVCNCGNGEQTINHIHSSRLPRWKIQSRF